MPGPVGLSADDEIGYALEYENDAQHRAIMAALPNDVASIAIGYINILPRYGKNAELCDEHGINVDEKTTRAFAYRQMVWRRAIASAFPDAIASIVAGYTCVDARLAGAAMMIYAYWAGVQIERCDYLTVDITGNQDNPLMTVAIGATRGYPLRSTLDRLTVFGMIIGEDPSGRTFGNLAAQLYGGNSPLTDTWAKQINASLLAQLESAMVRMHECERTRRLQRIG